MKKSTLVLVVIAAAVVGFVYWHEFKRPPKQQAETNPTVFHFQPEDVTAVTYARPGQDLLAERNGTGWEILQPVKTRADQNAVNGLLDEVTLARASRTLAPTAEQLKTFGLAPPAVTIELKLKNGQTHQLKIGANDYSGDNVYAMADGSPQVLLLSGSVAAQAKKGLNDLRDSSVLGISDFDVKSFDLKTAGGEIAAERAGGTGGSWSIEKPRPMAGDDTAIGQLLTNVASAKLASVVSEQGGGLARYGLDHPQLSLTVRLNAGGERALEIGKKQGDQYYARDTSRDAVFLVPASVEKQLDVKLFDLRDKKLMHSLPEDFSQLSYQAGSLRFTCGVDKDGNWVISAPAAEKGKAVANWKLFDPLSSNNATGILDPAPPGLAAKLNHPAVEIALTRKGGGTKTYRISAAEGDSVYVESSGEPGLYRVPKQMLDSLTFKSVTDVLR
ncbi:MAG TPA: DUF4340 domain-containing protein [Candidatus Acidoferrales bacterium]|nr:DUF4340 domain-containing protein [Candidatus Acidoferrales bacterium]